MKTIYKYPITPRHEVQELWLPLGSKILSVIEQDMQIQLYVSLEYPEAPKEAKHRFMVVGTGWELDYEGELFPRFIGSVKQGPFVWHVFELDDLPF